MIFEVVQNDITNMTVDSIVLPANEKLREGSGTSRAIFEKAGRKFLSKACHEIGHCQVGNAVPTLAFRLNADYIIHAVVPKWVDGNHNEYEYLSAAYLSALTVADIMKCETIAFPLLAAGNNGFDLGLAYEIAQNSINSFNGNSLKKAYLVLFGDNIATYMKGKGVSVVNLQYEESPDTESETRMANLRKLGDEGKQILLQILEDQMTKAIEYLKDDSNREKVVDAAFSIAKMVIQLAQRN